MKDIALSQTLESVRKNLPDPGPPISEDEHANWMINFTADSYDLPLEDQQVVRKVGYLRRIYFSVLDHAWRKIYNLPPFSPNIKLSKKDIRLREEILFDADQAIFNYVAIYKEGITSHPLIEARIKTAGHYEDDEFLDKLGKAISIKTREHKSSKVEIRKMAAQLLGSGKEQKEVYEALVDAQVWGDDPPQPDSFRKYLKRNGLI
jgi:hypothetical protein